MKRYSLMERIGTLMILSLSRPMIDSSERISAILSRMESRIFWRCRARSRALRSERVSEGVCGRKIVPIVSLDSALLLLGEPAPPGSSDRRCSSPARRSLIFPEVVRGVFQNHIDASRRIAVRDELLDHRIVLVLLLCVPRPRLRDNPRH